MYAHKFVPQNELFSLAVHDYCSPEKKTTKKRKRTTQPTKKIEEKSEICEVVEYVDVDVFVEENLDDYEEKSAKKRIVCDSSVQVNAIDSGIEVDDHVRVAGEELAYEFRGGGRFNASRVLYATDEKQLYVINSSSSVGQGWKCYHADKKKCLARVHLKGDRCTYANSTPHNHPRPDKDVIDLCFLNEVKSILSSITNTLAPYEVFHQVLKR